MSCEPQTHLKVKVGNTFKTVVLLKQSDGTPYNLTGATVRSHLKANGFAVTLVCTLLAQSGATLGKVELAAPSGGLATGWPVGELNGDVEYTFADGTKYTTPQFVVDVSETVTQ